MPASKSIANLPAIVAAADIGAVTPRVNLFPIELNLSPHFFKDPNFCSILSNPLFNFLIELLKVESNLPAKLNKVSYTFLLAIFNHLQSFRCYIGKY